MLIFQALWPRRYDPGAGVEALAKDRRRFVSPTRRRAFREVDRRHRDFWQPGSGRMCEAIPGQLRRLGLEACFRCLEVFAYSVLLYG
jgi:hypothetical protein